MSKEKGNLARDMESILDNIKTSFDLRIKSLGQTIADTHQMMDGFSKDHKEMAKELVAFLEKYNLKRIDDFGQLFNTISKENKEAAKELHAFLKKYNLDRIQDFFKFFKPIQNDVQGLHDAFKNFPQEMADHRSKPLGFTMGSVAQFRGQKPSSEEKSAKSFKVHGKKKKG